MILRNWITEVIVSLALTIFLLSSCARGLSLDKDFLEEIDKLNTTIASTKGAVSCLKSSVVYIRPEKFSLLLNSGKAVILEEEGHVTNQSFFHNFYRFLVPFGDSENEHDPTQLKNVLNTVAEYNTKNGRLGHISNAIELWVAIIPTANITSHLNQVFEIIDNVNSKYNGTVSTLLLNYRSLQLSGQCIPLLLEEINILKATIKSKFPKNFKSGIILERQNCMSEDVLTLTQALDQSDEIVFLSQLFSDIEIPSRRQFSAQPCTLLTYVVTKFRNITSAKSSAEITLKIGINLVQHTYTFQHSKAGDILYYCSVITNRANYTSFIFKVEIDHQNGDHNHENSPENRRINKAWLSQDIVFDKKRIGTSIHPAFDQNITLPHLIPELFRTFRYLVVEGHDSHKDYNATETKRLVYFMARYKASVVRQGTSQMFDDGIPVKMMIVANISNNKTLTRNSIRNAWKVSAIGSRHFPTIVVAVLLKFTICENLCEFRLHAIASSFEELLPVAERVSSFSSALKTSDEARDEFFNWGKPKVGVIWDLQTCETLAQTMMGVLLQQKNPQLKPVIASFSKIYFFVFKVVIHKQDLTTNGAEKTLAFIVQTCLDCERNMRFFYENRRIPTYIIKLVGCNGNSTNLKESIEIVKFWQLVNSWSVKALQTVIIDIAFEYRENFTDDAIDCSKNSTNLENPACHCGWWHVSKTLNANNSFDFKLETKKDIAVKLYESLEYKASAKNSSFFNGTSSHGANKNDSILFVSIVASIVTLVMVLVLVLKTFSILRNRSKHFLSKEEMGRFHEGGQGTSGPETSDLTLETSGRAESQPYNKEKYEVAHSSYKIDTTRTLGTGEFGTVCCGTIKQNNDEQVEVAVKMINKSKTDKCHGRYLALKGLLSEIKILSYVGEHPNVIRLLGAYTAKMKSGIVLVFLEVCEFGSLDKYLRQLPHGQAKKEVNIRPYVNMLGRSSVELKVLHEGLPNSKSEMLQDLHRLSVEIANGMEYLASKKIVHADLSTRNILLSKEKTAKISDFGLSRRLYDYSEYFKTNPEPLPWRWMAPESLRRMLFNEKTDVWAFGVTLWEMFNLGDVPYPGLTWDVNFLALLERGLRLPEPRYNQGENYSVMKRCWELAPERRPSFTELYSILKN